MNGSNESNESGIDELRRFVRMADATRESAFDGFTAEGCVKLMRACCASKYYILPDDLTVRERAYASRLGGLSNACLARLDHELGGNASRSEVVSSDPKLSASLRKRGLID